LNHICVPAFVAHLTPAHSVAGYSGGMKTFQNFAELSNLVGQEVVVSDWITITQEQVNQFAEATGDDQWIHVDIEKAKTGPYGGTIAHGFLTLSLIPQFFISSLNIVEKRMGVNYGLNKVRFTAPVPVGSRLRAHMKLLSSEPIDNDGVQMSWQVSIEREGLAKPVCVAESLARYY
jgi:acyl dehydratase